MKNVLLITPNIPEAEILTNQINSTTDMIKAEKVLISLGAKCFDERRTFKVETNE